MQLSNTIPAPNPKLNINLSNEKENLGLFYFYFICSQQWWLSIQMSHSVKKMDLSIHVRTLGPHNVGNKRHRHIHTIKVLIIDTIPNWYIASST